MDVLPSWRAGPTRTAVLEFLAAARDVPVEQRVAYFDNDGTLWCERPSYVQWDFLVDQLRQRVTEDPSIAQQPEFAACMVDKMSAFVYEGRGVPPGVRRRLLRAFDRSPRIAPLLEEAVVARAFGEAAMTGAGGATCGGGAP